MRGRVSRAPDARARAGRRSPGTASRDRSPTGTRNTREECDSCASSTPGRALGGTHHTACCPLSAIRAARPIPVVRHTSDTGGTGTSSTADTASGRPAAVRCAPASVRGTGEDHRTTDTIPSAKAKHPLAPIIGHQILRFLTTSACSCCSASWALTASRMLAVVAEHIAVLYSHPAPAWADETEWFLDPLQIRLNDPGCDYEARIYVPLASTNQG